MSRVGTEDVQTEKGDGVDLQGLHDKIEIQELLARYARGVDSKDWALWKTVFTSDAHVDYTSAGAPAGPRDEIADWLARSLAALPMTQHFITNVEIQLDGDLAKVRAMFYNPMQLPGVEGLSFCGGYYHHEMVRTTEGWKSHRMVEENLWFDNPPPTAPTSTAGDGVPRSSRPAPR